MEIEHGVSVKILFFAQSKELAGTREATIVVPRKITYKQLLDIIVRDFNLELIKNNILLAKNEEVCDESLDLEFNAKDSLAVIPPLSGG